MSNLKQVIEESFTQYAGAVLQSRALVDVRDGLKPSARQIFYCMDKYKYTADKPYQKTMAAIGDAMKHFYIHGDSSCEGIIMRAGQGFAMRYPLVTVKGNGGTLIESGNWAAPRYTEAKLSKLAGALFNDIEKNTIEEWRDNYSETEQYPMVLPSKGFYNIVNGSTGIGIGMACSIPQYNLTEINNALIHLIDNPDCSFDEIYCAPDFATGAILYNEAEVKESMKNGHGFACKLRSVVEFDSKERCFIVTEIPYSVYTNTICGELENIIMSEENPGVERFNDLTGSSPLIKIYLNKKASPDKVLHYLYKNTSLQYYYSINFTMLDKGRFPKVFTWKEMLQAHIDHEKEVYRRGFEFDLVKIKNRMHIVEGLIFCMDHIDEIVSIIKTSATTVEASSRLMKQFPLDETQVKAILDMKLSRLAHLEVKKLADEYKELETESNRLFYILNDATLFKEQLKNGWKEISRLFGDSRRTKVISLAENTDNDVIEEKQISLSFTNEGGVYVAETSSLYAQKRNGVGAKFKLSNGEYIVDNVIGRNTDEIIFFTSHGNFYHMKMGDFVIDEKQYLSNFINLLPYEHIVAASLFSNKKYIIFITKNGILKKSKLSEYNLKRNIGATAIKLDKEDIIVSVLFVDEENIGIASKQGNFIMIQTKDINSIGRVARGVCRMKLNEGDLVTSAHCLPNTTKEIISVTTDGYIKRSSINEFKITGRATKGTKIQNTETLCDFLPVYHSNDIVAVSSTSQIRIKLVDIPLLGRSAQGVKVLKLPEGSKIQNLMQI